MRVARQQPHAVQNKHTAGEQQEVMNRCDGVCALARALPERSASPLALPRACSAPTMATPTTFPAISACSHRDKLIGLATHRVSENRTLTKISQDPGQRLNSFMILSVTEWDTQFPAKNRDPRIDRQ